MKRVAAVIVVVYALLAMVHSLQRRGFTLLRQADAAGESFIPFDPLDHDFYGNVFACSRGVEL